MNEPDNLPELSDLEREVYSWQTTVDGFGEEGQRKLKGASVLVSRIGGLGGLAAYELAASPIERETQAFLRAVAGQHPAPVSILDGLHTMRLVERLMEKLR